MTGLATARALARRGAEVTLHEQFAIGNPRGSSHGSSRIFRLSYPDARWVRQVARGAAALARARGRSRASCCCSREARSTCARLRRTCVRSPRRAHGTSCSRRTRSSGAGRSVPTASRRSTSRTARSSMQAARSQPSGRARRRPAPEILEGSRVASPAELEADAVVLTAGAWVGRLADVDVEPTVETVGYAAFADGGYPAVMDWTESGDGRAFYALAAPGVGAEGRPAQVGPAGRPRRSRGSRPGAARAHRLLARAPLRRRRRSGHERHVPLHEHGRRRVRLRAARPDRRRLGLQRARLQVRARCSEQRLARLALAR